jgi:hypothetical protein
MSTCIEEIAAKPHCCHINPVENAQIRGIYSVVGVQTQKKKRGRFNEDRDMKVALPQCPGLHLNW